MYTNLLSPLLYMPPIQVPIQEKCLLFMHIRYPKNTYPTHFKQNEAVRKNILLALPTKARILCLDAL